MMNKIIMDSAKEFITNKVTMSEEEFNAKYDAHDIEMNEKMLNMLKEIHVVSEYEEGFQDRDNMIKKYREIQMEYCADENIAETLKLKLSTEFGEGVGEILRTKMLKNELYLLSFAKRGATVEEVLKAYNIVDTPEPIKLIEKRDVYVVKYGQSNSSTLLTSHWGIKVGSQLFHIFYDVHEKRTRFSPKTYAAQDNQLDLILVGQTSKSDEEIEDVLQTLANNHQFSIATNNCQVFVNNGLRLILATQPKHDYFNTRDVLIFSAALVVLLVVAFVALGMFYLGKNQRVAAHEL